MKKKCRCCGKIKDITMFVVNNRKQDGYDTICKKCKNNKKYHLNRNKNDVNEYMKLYRKNSDVYKNYHNEYEKKRRRKEPVKDYMSEYNKKYRKLNPEKNLKNQKKQCELLNDNYVISQIKRETNLSSYDIREYPELIEVKRQIIKTKRLWKTLQN